ncbi:MAG TPA: hypothetical protein VN229_02395 [Terriglobales bacterium]|nr:hypothetical protein [Terriglobales bacterium]
MSASIWDLFAGTGLSIVLLTIFLVGSARIRRPAFLAFCFLALSAFAWHAGCWYHQLQCPAISQATTLAQG